MKVATPMETRQDRRDSTIYIGQKKIRYQMLISKSNMMIMSRSRIQITAVVTHIEIKYLI